MTLQEAKDQIAIEDGHEAGWNLNYEFGLNQTSMKIVLEKAAMLYARSKWDEACDHYHAILIDRLESETHVTFVPPKPEFKP